MEAKTDIISSATEYLNAGLTVIALSGKLPNGAIHRHGLHEALIGTIDSDADREMLRGVFEHSETTGIGIVIPKFVVVVDIDGEEGARNWRKLVGERDFVPYTPVARTARGLHVWFLAPADMPSAKLAPKLDLKGRNSYVVAPPSVHPDGSTYEWLQPLVVDGMIRGMEWLPEWK